MSPDRALKETVEWKPVVSRKPRMDAQLRLDINRLKSQKEEMRKATAGDQFGVYAYLRENDSANGKAGSPYYIGKMASARRPWGKHTTRPPSDPRRVRLLRGGLTEQEANEWEMFYIKKYGRIDLGTGGLRNLTDGGEGVAGRVITPQIRERITAGRIAHGARKYEVKTETWASLSNSERKTVMRWLSDNPGSTFEDYQKYALAGGRGAALAQKWGLPADVYKQMSRTEKQQMIGWIRRHPGKTGVDYLDELKRGNVVHGGIAEDERMKRAGEAAAKYGVALRDWLKLDKQQVKNVAKRYARGIRGAALLRGYI
jgi:hypothetical protein